MAKKSKKKDVRLEIPNEQILDSAKQFSKSVDLLNDQDGVLWPLVINCAFACELYIKSLIAEEFIFEDNYKVYASPFGPVTGGIHNAKSFARGHNLSDLLGKVQDKEREQAQALLEVDFIDLEKLATKCAKAFESCRYAFECKPEFDLQALLKLHSLLKIFVPAVSYRMAYKNSDGKYEDVLFIKD